MEEFLKSRNVSQAVIQQLEDDKIDCETVVLMTDDNLRRYLSAYGDRVALMAFARNRLRSTLSNTDSNTGASRVPRQTTSNKNAQKPNRRLELGWVNLNKDTNLYKQVRTPNGGGTRHFAVEKTLCMNDFIDTAFETFFPNGTCKYGPREEFVGELRDFKGDSLKETSTVNDLYVNSRMKLLRIYLYTKQVDPVHNQHALAPTDQLEPATDHTTDQIEPATDHTTDQLEPATDHTDDQLEQETDDTAYQLESETDQPFLESGTPEVTFHPRYAGRLRLQRTTLQQYNTIQAGPSSSQSTFDIGLDSEDEDIQQAIQASLNDVLPVEESDTTDLKDLLSDFQKTAVINDTQTKLIVFRGSILESSIRALDSKTLNLKARLYVKFSGEIGEDFGGPRREFFRLAISALHESRYFEGPETSKIFTHDLSSVENNHYLIIGRLVALSLAQEGPGLHFMDHHLFDIMVERDTKLTDADVPGMPQELREIIQQLQDVDTHEKRDKFLVEHGDRLLDQGLGNPYSLKVETKGQMIHMLKKHHLYYRISSEVAQFIQGMNEVSGAWEFVKKNSAAFKPLFCHSPRQLSAEELSKIFKVSYSEIGTNARTLEDVTVYAWEMFVQSIEEEEVPVTFGDLLSFATGADQIPPCGFPKSIDINFYSDRRLPSASTCALQLWFPRLEDPGSFSGLLVRAIQESSGFLKI